MVDPPISPRKRHAFLEGRHKPKLQPPPREIRYATGVAVHIPPQFTAELAVAKDVMQQVELQKRERSSRPSVLDSAAANLLPENRPRPRASGGGGGGHTPRGAGGR